MTSKLFIPMITFFLFSLIINAQNNFYYYYRGQKVILELDKSKINLVTNVNFNSTETSDVGLKNYSLQQDQVITNNKYGAVEFQTEPSLITFYQKLNLLKSKPNLKSIGLFFKRNGTTSIGTSNYFYVKLKTGNDVNILQQYSSSKNVQIVKQVPNMNLWYVMSTSNSQFTSLELSNQYYESGLFSNVDPAFMFNFKNSCATDPLFGSQWGLNNIANPSADINACQAWTLSQGSGIKVAVVDTGIDLAHNDLQANILNLSYDCQTQTSPSFLRPLTQGFPHGTHVAGIIGAVKDNNLQIAGVAPQSKLMSISHSLIGNPTISFELANGISWAYQNGADIINNSWGDPSPTGNNLGSEILENAINLAMTLGRANKGTIVVFASGNEGASNSRYPASVIPNIIAVGAISSDGNRWVTPIYASNYGNALDVVAPGAGVLSTIPNNNTDSVSGTSQASPHVAGVIALMLAANPALTLLQVTDIIEQTAQKIGSVQYATTVGRPNGTWNEEMGYGLIDAHASVLLAIAQIPVEPITLDLMVKDSGIDIGLQPNTLTQYMWNSEDIWVRNNPDNGLVHQNPDYSASGNPNYIYVRVKNKSGITSSGTNYLKVYWAKAGTSLNWPENWNGGVFSTGQTSGQLFGTEPIPVIPARQEIILQIPWIVPNPSDYALINPEPWHFCLLARIESTIDPMAFPETADLNANVRNNNNIAWKNVTVVDVIANKLSSVVSVGNPFNEPHTFFLELHKEELETGKPIYDEAEVSIKMDETLYNAWVRGGEDAQLLDSTNDERRKVVRGNNVILDNISFYPNEIGTLNLQFNFLTEELTNKAKFVYHIVQKDALTGDIIGGETYVINKEERTIFHADAGADKSVNKNEPIVITATQITEPAIYNWYDELGNLIYQGTDLNVSTTVAQKYKLEVIATADGFKDYAEVEVVLKPSTLGTISPNPASNNVNIAYNLNEEGTAYLMILGSYGANNTSSNYILNTNNSAINIDLSSYQNGYYTVALISNGQIVDAKTLIKQ